MQLTIEIDEGRTLFLPSETIRGMFSWQLDKPAKAVELRLFWYTQGKGDSDLKIMGTRRVESPTMAGQERFDLNLPAEPYSYSGKLISILWALELVTDPGSEAERVELVVSPTGEPFTAAMSNLP